MQCRTRRHSSQSIRRGPASVSANPHDPARGGGFQGLRESVVVYFIFQFCFFFILWDRACVGWCWRAAGEGGGRGGKGGRRGGRTSEVFGNFAICLVEHHDRDGVHHHWNLALRDYLVYLYLLVLLSISLSYLLCDFYCNYHDL